MRRELAEFAMDIDQPLREFARMRGRIADPFDAIDFGENQIDVLGKGQQGLGLLEEDSYICEVYAKKELVEDQAEEGLRIIIEEYEDEEMQKVLKEFYSKKSKVSA